MNTEALDLLGTAVKRTKRMLATFNLYDRTMDLSTIGQSDDRFTQLVSVETHAAGQGIQAAMDHFDGDTLTKLDTALDEVAQTRSAYNSKTARSAQNAFGHAQAAYDAIYSAYQQAVQEAGETAA